MLTASVLTLSVVSPASAAPVDYQSEDAVVSQGVVESNWSGYTGRGFVNYDNVVGSYVEYTVSAAQAGTYSLVFRYAHGSGVDRPLNLSVNGGTPKSLSFPATPTWDTWATASTTVVLAAGSNKIRGTATTAQGGPNADKLTVDFVAPADTQAPSAPTGLRSTGKSSTTVSLAWNAASDNVGVVGYDIYQHGQLVTSVGNVLQGTASGLIPNTEYDWTVFAKDAAGNVSLASNNVLVRTDPAPADTVAPSVPGSLRSPSKTATSVDLAWTASTDNVAVVGYDIFRDGVQTGTSDGPSSTVAGLTTGRQYLFRVRARDAAGNVSALGNEIAVTPSASGPAGVPNPGAVTTLASGVDVPWGIAFLPDGSALFSEREFFTVYRLTEGGQRTNVGNVPNVVGTGGEGGLLGLEVGPNFASDGFVYIYHTANEGNRVARMRLVNNQLVEYTVLLQGLAKNRFHNGGRLRVGPDGKLYITSGDAQNGNNAQDRNSLNGKILRINLDGSIPSDNPFGNAVWSMGHRNPQGLDFDAQGRLWSAEFGNTSLDEVNLITKGGNYGWPSCEGNQGSCGGFIAPKKIWSTSQASPSGLTIINNYVFVATTVGQRLYRMRIDANANLVEEASYFQGTYGRLRTVETDRNGDIWLTTTADKDGAVGNDSVLRIDIVYSGGKALKAV
ncbi:PQQ-dependent sugar dehydrogenase [Umezawaea sp. NPDC059074]|uniref:PQQ-dependent sugar dehydrogenase n=1 Tax=Umezawaea sp. NPDC059074 TaxID=3346716 RepID=UPI00369553F5